MAIQTPGAFFLGTLVPSEQKFLKVILENARKSGYNKVIEPCCGAFAMSHLAVQAGFKPEQIQASDITLFSSIMGYALMEKPMNELCIKAKGFSDDELLDYPTALYALLYLKTTRTSGNEFYYSMLKDLEERREDHIERIRGQLDRGRNLLKGFNYRPLDMYKHLEEVFNDEQAIIIANPPTYKSGFEKWYDTGGNMTWNEPDYSIFDPETGLIELMDMMKESKSLILCYEENEIRKAAGVPVFSRYGVRKGYNVYLTTNREAEAEDLAEGKIIVRPNEKNMAPLNCSTMPSDHEITEQSTINFASIEPQNSQYYRGVWTHNFVGGAAQVNVGLFIDGYIAGVLGYQLAISGKVFKEILIMYGITAPHSTFRLNRLLTMIAMNRETLKSLLTDYQLDRLVGIQTTQMTKYPESKEMRGIMKLSQKDKGKLGYKLIYKGTIQERTKEQTLSEWLKKEMKWRMERQKAKTQQEQEQ